MSTVRCLYPISLAILFVLNLNAQPVWQSQTSPVGEDLVTVSFPNASQGWAAGREGSIIHTMNGGMEWKMLCHLKNVQPSKIVFLDETTGWLAGSFGSYPDTACIFKTTNGGSDWILKLSLPNAVLRDIFFLNDTMSWAVGFRTADTLGIRFHTTDSWGSFKLQDDGINVLSIYNSVHFRDTVNGDLCGPGPVLMHTWTGGRRAPWWGLDIKKIEQAVFDLVNVGADYGCMVGAGGKLIFTKDQWMNFIEYDYSGGDTLWSVDALEPVAFWIAGADGTILFAGYSSIIKLLSVKDHSMDIPEDLFEVDALDDSHVWAVGENGTILFYGTPPVSTGLTEKENSLIIYPNPAGSSVFISGAEKYVRIFSLQGKVLAEYRVPPYEESLNIDLKEFPEGCYLVQSGSAHSLLYVGR